MDPDFALIVLNYNDYSTTIKNINKILSFYNNDFKIIIVDNCSINDSYQQLKNEFKNKNNFYIIKTEKNKGYSYGNNYGIKFIMKKFPIKYIGIMNPDVNIINKNTFKNLINILEQNNDIAIISAIVIENNMINLNKIGWKIPSILDLIIYNSIILSKLFNFNKYENIKLYKNNINIGLVDVVQGSFFIIKSKIFEKIKFLDENTFLYFEENILSTKLKRLNFKCAISLNDFYIHEHNYLRKNIKIRYLNYLRILSSELYYIKKYKNYLFIPFVLITAIIRLLFEMPLFELFHKIKEVTNEYYKKI